MIGREQVADLREGDVVELTDVRWPEGTVLRGPTYFRDGELRVGHLTLATRDGLLYLDRPHTSLTIVSRAPRLYVNHDRTEPVPGDVVRSAEFNKMRTTWRWIQNHWVDQEGTVAPDLDFPLRLLVDGETGQVVP